MDTQRGFVFVYMSLGLAELIRNIHKLHGQTPEHSHTARLADPIEDPRFRNS
jgi:hypothetical protein